MNRLATGVLGTAVALAIGGPAYAGGTPSGKAAMAFGNIVSLGTACAVAGVDENGVPLECANGETNDTGFHTILETTIKTAEKKYLGLDMALQCSLLTDTTVRGKDGELDGANAEAGIRVRIKATDSAGDVYYAYPSDDASPYLQEEPEGVTYCYRFQQIEAKFGGLNCTADMDPYNDIVDGTVTCADPEHLRLLLRTLSAHAFNFVMPVGAEVYTIEVQARAQSGADVFGTELGAARGEALIGLGSLLVEELRVADGGVGLSF